MDKQFSSACERNREPILAVLRHAFADRARVLEIGSGTGQHAVFFGARLPHLLWQTSDLPVNHASIRAWQTEAGLPNVLPPLTLDVAAGPWPEAGYDAIFSANTLHIMSWSEVQALFAGVGRLLPAGGVLCIYGPFRYGGAHTSASNAQFDAALRARAAHMGIRDAQEVDRLAAEHGLRLEGDFDMPVNNRLRMWKKEL